jgi:multiple sugar transport system substrate-binding protein
LAYRRDILEKHGIDEKTAFQTAQSLNETVARLSGCISESPWVVPIAADHLDTLHYVASWVWGANGDFFTPDNLQTAFLEPATLDAICSYYTLLRSMNFAETPSNKLIAQNIFMDGNAAITIIGADNAYSWFLGHEKMSAEMREKIAFAPIPGTPWVGGDTLIIWKQASMSPDRENATVTLAQHLVSAETQRWFAQGEFIHLPTHVDALDALPMQNTSLTDSVMYSLRAGRSHRPMSMWARIEHQFANVFGRIGTEILAGANVSATVHKHLEAHAKWLDRALTK